MSGPVLLWEHLAAGLVQPLDDFLAGAGEGYDPEDFLGAVLSANRWTGRFGEGLGVGPLLAVPVNCESYNLAYVPSILSRCGLDVPTTSDRFFAAADHITRATGGSVGGSGSGESRSGTRCTPDTRPSSGPMARPTSTSPVDAPSLRTPGVTATEDSSGR